MGEPYGGAGGGVGGVIVCEVSVCGSVLVWESVRVWESVVVWECHSVRECH